MSYEKKFATLIELCARLPLTEDERVVMVSHPQVLGDNYDEIVESLNRIANAGLTLMVLPENARAGQPSPPQARH